VIVVVCLTSAFDAFGFTGISSGGKFRYVPIGPPMDVSPPMDEN
jgi:hypothetical protein